VVTVASRTPAANAAIREEGLTRDSATSAPSGHQAHSFASLPPVTNAHLQVSTASTVPNTSGGDFSLGSSQSLKTAATSSEAVIGSRSSHSPSVPQTFVEFSVKTSDRDDVGIFWKLVGNPTCTELQWNVTVSEDPEMIGGWIITFEVPDDIPPTTTQHSGFTGYLRRCLGHESYNALRYGTPRKLSSKYGSRKAVKARREMTVKRTERGE
jgi:hypothetical protein